MYYSIFKDLCDEFSVKPYTVAKKIGVNPSYFSNWKAGRKTPGTDTLLKIAEYFNVSMDYLKGNTTDRNENIPSIKSIAEQDAKMVSDTDFMKIVRNLYEIKESNPENFFSFNESQNISLKYVTDYEIHNSINLLSSKDKNTLKEFIDFLLWKKNNPNINSGEGDDNNL